MVSSNEIRKQFIEFFENRQHKAVPSAPVIPLNDPTLLFTNAGMNQFKDIFLGKVKPEFPRAVDSQKCIRAGGKHNDLEEVGRDGYHHTFFEMLGNWSFADYYKKEAITWAWELLTAVWKLPPSKLYATVHKADKEAHDLWLKLTDLDAEHVEYHGDKDNFWEMGNTGPCGPCSEIHIDRGEKFCNRRNESGHLCRINGDCQRFIELWNLVFIQYNREEDGSLTPLENKYVDTGAGFERLTQILQGVESNYDTDLFQPLIREVENISGHRYNQGESGISHRVIADHIRALTFALADGGMPSNEGRGYVLRRILRRAARHGRLLGLHEPFLYKLVKVVAEIMGDYFQELKEKKAHIELIIRAEEERFNLTLDNGLAKFDEIISALRKSKTSVKTIAGKDAFMLYDTFGFPLDLTRVMAEEKGYEVDQAGFEQEMALQQERARQAGKFEMKATEIEKLGFSNIPPTLFSGYGELNTRARIIHYFIDDEKNAVIVLDKTPFYAESGGQTADHGRIYNEEFEVVITDVQKENNIFYHFGKLIKGEIDYSEVTAIVEKEYRLNIARNHTATHLLHKALREVLGEHVQQKGSLVHPDYLRFDFTHYQATSPRELAIVENLVNRKVRDCIALSVTQKELNEAKKAGAVALFGEKYEERVRVVSIGDYSMELCGGTHLNCTGEIGLFKIRSEASIASGIRRIEAITGEQAERYIKQIEDTLEDISRLLNVPDQEILDRITRMLAEHRELQKEIADFQLKAAAIQLDEILDQGERIGEYKVAIASIKAPDNDRLKAVGDILRDKIGSGIGVLFAEINEKVSILTIVSRDLNPGIHAGKLSARIAELVDGRGGGRPDMAMSGGKAVEKIPEAIAATRRMVRDLLS